VPAICVVVGYPYNAGVPHGSSRGHTQHVEWQPGIGYHHTIYTTEIGKHCKSGPLSPRKQLLNIYQNSTGQEHIFKKLSG